MLRPPSRAVTINPPPYSMAIVSRSFRPLTQHNPCFSPLSLPLFYSTALPLEARKSLRSFLFQSLAKPTTRSAKHPYPSPCHHAWPRLWKRLWPCALRLPPFSQRPSRNISDPCPNLPSKTLLSHAQAWLHTRSRYVPRKGITKLLRPTLLTNNVDGDFNWVVYTRLTDVMNSMNLPRYLTNWVASFQHNSPTAFCLQRACYITVALPIWLTSGLARITKLIYFVYFSNLQPDTPPPSLC